MRVAIITTPNRFRDDAMPWTALRDGLVRIGSDVKVVAPSSWPILSRFTDAVFIWNGMKGSYPDIVSRFISQGTSVVIAERGFFRRKKYTQFDSRGFNHQASWASEFYRVAPLGSSARFFKAWGSSPARQVSRDDGYILVLGQMPGDAQLADAQIRCPERLAQAVKDAAPKGMKVVLRRHPLSVSARQESLCEMVRGARFCVTINSNSANEVIALGCPVLAIGPALFTMARVALESAVEILRQQLERMADGWVSQDERAVNYLYHLASRQYNEAELREGSVTSRILTQAIEDRTYVIHS